MCTETPGLCSWGSPCAAARYGVCRYIFAKRRPPETDRARSTDASLARGRGIDEARLTRQLCTVSPPRSTSTTVIAPCLLAPISPSPCPWRRRRLACPPRPSFQARGPALCATSTTTRTPTSPRCLRMAVCQLRPGKTRAAGGRTRGLLVHMAAPAVPVSAARAVQAGAHPTRLRCRPSPKIQYVHICAPITLITSPSPATQVSTALSSPLNTPDLADWPTRLGGSQSLLLDNFVSPGNFPPSVARYSKTSPPRHGANSSTYRPRFASGSSRSHQFPSPHLDPPLLNFIPGLPPLKLPLPDISVEFPHQDSPSPSSPGRTYERYPTSPGSPLVQRVSGSPPSFPVSYQSSPSTASEADSPVLPPSNVAQSLGEEAEPLHSHAHAQEMDAFALATAVAASHSRSSFSLPPSVQSVGALPFVGTGEVAADSPRTPVHRRLSPALAGQRSQTVPSLQEETHGQDSGVSLLSEHPERTRTRRVSAPQPSIWRSTRPALARTISSRVDVGEDGRKHKSLRQPVLGKVRKIGERLRGLFKSKGESAPGPRAISGFAAAGCSPDSYGLMTTTTAITNVEYESVR